MEIEILDQLLTLGIDKSILQEPEADYFQVISGGSAKSSSSTGTSTSKRSSKSSSGRKLQG